MVMLLLLIPTSKVADMYVAIVQAVIVNSTLHSYMRVAFGHTHIYKGLCSNSSYIHSWYYS